MIKELLEAATDIAKIGGHHTLSYFKQDIEVQNKEDDSPVTIADRETEQIMRAEITKRFPDHGIIGEEYARYNEESEIQWVIDPIDGTKSFIHGIPFYTTLIGVLVNKEPKVGIIYAPALEELCAAGIGEGIRLNGKECRVRATQSLEEATLLLTDVHRFKALGQQELLEELMERTRLHRTWGDAYGHMMVATGRADLMYDPELNIWDAAALLPVLKEAGGIFCDRHGNETIYSEHGFSTTRTLFPAVKEIFDTYNS